jgi:hypothetical protein
MSDFIQFRTNQGDIWLRPSAVIGVARETASSTARSRSRSRWSPTRSASTRPSSPPPQVGGSSAPARGAPRHKGDTVLTMPDQAPTARESSPRPMIFH